MKKSVLIISLILLLVVSFVSAQENNSTEDTRSQIEKAYACLEDKINSTTCSKLSIEENIFSLLAVGKCKQELINRGRDDECWPKENCVIKSTAQSVLALSKSDSNVDKGKSWLVAQSGNPEGVTWYLQIDSNEQTTCRISYDGSPYTTSITSERRFTSGAGSCLTLETGREWWLRISSTCLDKEFEISCDTGFSTSLLFRKADSPIFYVSENTHSASPEGTTREKINSLCFKQGGSCNYEGTLWAALVLNSLGEDVLAYIPYLVTMAEENSQYLPESFIYGITGYTDFKIDLLQKQKVNKYWEESTGRRFYDTAVALLNINDEPTEKTNSKNWLLEIQGKDGCWDGGNILNNAFILYSIWPRTFKSPDIPDLVDCEEAGFYCMSSIDCTGEILRNYRCGGVAICCSVQRQLKSCVELGGQVCNPSETRCVGGSFQESSGLSAGETCCVGGYCAEPIQTPECEQRGGKCRSSCWDDEEEESSYSCDFGDTCCMKKTEKIKEGSWTWIIILLILIALVILGIIFREKLRPIWFKIKNKFRKGGPPSGIQSPGFRRPPGPPTMTRPQPNIPIRRGFPQRRIFPPPQRAPIKKPEQRAGLSKEHEDILKKLKEMGGN